MARLGLDVKQNTQVLNLRVIDAHFKLLYGIIMYNDGPLGAADITLGHAKMGTFVENASSINS